MDTSSVIRRYSVVNQAGLVPSSSPNRTAQIVNTIVAAGATLPISQAGEGFYIIAASGPVLVRPRGGVWDSYYVGTGLKADPENAFDLVELRNPSAANSLTVSLWVGFGDYIDHRLLAISDLFFPIVYATYPTPAAAAQIDIPDLSGTQIDDVNGTPWLALNRIALQASNNDPANFLQIRDWALSTPVRSIITVFPLQSVTLPISGDFRCKIGAGNIDAVVSEIYNCIAPSI